MISLGPDVASCKQLAVIIYPSEQQKKKKREMLSAQDVDRRVLRPWAES